jgi:hypothetical protein
MDSTLHGDVHRLDDGGLVALGQRHAASERDVVGYIAGGRLALKARYWHERSPLPQIGNAEALFKRRSISQPMRRPGRAIAFESRPAIRETVGLNCVGGIEFVLSLMKAPRSLRGCEPYFGAASPASWRRRS